MKSTNENLNQEKNVNYNNEKENTKLEKNIIISLIILAIILLFISTFFIHDIIDTGTINSTQTTQINYPEPNKPDDNNNNNSNNNNNNNNGNNNNDNNNNDINNGNNSGNNSGNNNNNTQPIIVDEEARIRILEESTDWSQLKELDIFKTNYECVKEGKIAPGVQGTYIYTVENYGEKPMVYDMKYTDENPYKINMVYKLKRNGQYVAGNENTWVNLSKLDLKDLKIKSKTTDIYSLEWKWEDSENDTEIGETEGAYYKLFISSYAEEDVQ